MGAPEPLEIMSVYSAGGCPAFRRTEYDHRPARASEVALLPGSVSIFTNFINATLHSCCHGLMHAVDFGPFHKIRVPAVSADEILELLMRDSRQQCWVIDFVSIEVENREYGTIPLWVQELVDVPRGRKRTCF